MRHWIVKGILTLAKVLPCMGSLCLSLLSIWKCFIWIIYFSLCTFYFSVSPYCIYIFQFLGCLVFLRIWLFLNLILSLSNQFLARCKLSSYILVLLNCVYFLVCSFCWWILNGSFCIWIIVGFELVAAVMMLRLIFLWRN